jgi:hypothetical protein
MNKLSTLLRQRADLLRQVRLANLASAYQTLDDLARRIARAHLAGRVTITHAAPEEERYWPALTALELNQSVIEEHFTDEDVCELAAVLAFTTGESELTLTFRIEDFAELFLAPVRDELEREGVRLDDAPVAAPESEQR